ncbi:diheme cytochrome c-553 [Acidobacteria bacterium ACD]|nr:MAG: diheme cytochrome c-553 [Acidobacteriota bacterium]MDL1950438.1 diheme cytochrome c-553 [Acidobacteria bacterium ACD]
MRNVSMVTVGGALALFALTLNGEVPSAAGNGNAASPAERGAYLVKIMGCNDCHTPWKVGPKGPEPDMTRMLSGHPQDLAMPAPAVGPAPWLWAGAGTNTAFAGPWGVSFTANLTPDPKTGLGTWDEATFVEAIRSGRHEGKGRPILPPMPWTQYRNATDEDLRALFAYLRTIPPVVNRVPQPIDPVESH